MSDSGRPMNYCDKHDRCDPCPFCQAIADATADLRTRLAALEGKWREEAADRYEEAKKAGYHRPELNNARASTLLRAADALKAELEKSE